MRDVGDGQVLVLQLDDEDMARSLPDLRWSVLHHVLAGRRHVVVDLAQVTELSSTAVAALLNIHRVLRSRGGTLVVQRPGPAARQLLAHTGLHRVLRLDVVPAQHEQAGARP